MVHRSKYKSKTIKLIEENIEENLCNFRYKNMNHKNFDKLNLTKIKNFCSSEDTVNKMKRKPKTNYSQYMFPKEDMYLEYIANFIM